MPETFSHMRTNLDTQRLVSSIETENSFQKIFLKFQNILSLQQCRIKASPSPTLPIISWVPKYLTCPKPILSWFSAFKFVLVAKKNWGCLITAIVIFNNTIWSGLLPSPWVFTKLFSKLSYWFSEKLCFMKKWGNCHFIQFCIIFCKLVSETDHLYKVCPTSTDRTHKGKESEPSRKLVWGKATLSSPVLALDITTIVFLKMYIKNLPSYFTSNWLMHIMPWKFFHLSYSFWIHPKPRPPSSIHSLSLRYFYNQHVGKNAPVYRFNVQSEDT